MYFIKVDCKSEIHGARAQPLLGRLKGKPGTCAVLEEQIHHGNSGKALGDRGVGVDSLSEGLGDLEDRKDVVPGHASEAGEVADAEASRNSECGLRHGDRV